ncbi:PP2C family protein-serine/threonine phosphatase [Gilvimarinus sp. F26214L]|uniref:PP2C family protein-serine/threonine phosphatase n=1 Tax=Gilvimarinus sp. DZF01 TaxID=3461371 RepID=UPI0040467A5C
MSVSKSSAASDKGLIRRNNEDNYLSLPEHGLWLVADGMGGHEAGEVASAIVVETLQESARNGTGLVESIRSAHRAVLEAVEEGRGAEGMGSTIVALHSDGADFQVAWVGDSRAYLWTPAADGGCLERLSTDHSYVQMLIASGAIGEQEAANHPDKNIITQCIGSQDCEQVQVDTVRGQWREGQWILLCSDGLSDELSDEAIADILSHSDTLREAVNRLMHDALEHGGRDNITVQIVESPLPGAARRRPAWPDLLQSKRVQPAVFAAAGFIVLLLAYLMMS